MLDSSHLRDDNAVCPSATLASMEVLEELLHVKLNMVNGNMAPVETPTLGHSQDNSICIHILTVLWAYRELKLSLKPFCTPSQEVEPLSTNFIAALKAINSLELLGFSHDNYISSTSSTS